VTRILFCTRRRHHRHFVPLLDELGRRGHEIVLAFPSPQKVRIKGILRNRPNITALTYDEVSAPRFADAVALLRHLRDYGWYLSPEQEIATYNRHRALEQLLETAGGGTIAADPSWPDPPVQVDQSMRRRLDAELGGLDLALPPDPGVVELVHGQSPDVVLVSPLVLQGSHQTEVVKAARSLGVPSGFLVHSWDNLSNKGRVHVAPDKVYVWNDIQRREAVELHGIPAENVVVTGATHWDPFFELAPSSTFEQFCAGHGFDPAEPIVLYLGSTKNMSTDEPLLVDRWLAAVRSAPGRLARANILVRPHPKEGRRWLGWRPSGERVAASSPDAADSQGLYDELHHATAAVGLNTSAQIEASILGTPVYSFFSGDLTLGQRGSLHFYYLLEENGGAVTYAQTLQEHLGQLERGITGDFDRERISRFCEAFVRPRGLDLPVTPILADEILALAGR
jgi:hypothetical protein